VTLIHSVSFAIVLGLENGVKDLQNLSDFNSSYWIRICAIMYPQIELSVALEVADLRP
jgi:hypothetical protein